MRQQVHNTAKLPRQLLEELGVSGDKANRLRNRQQGPADRKGQRKAARLQKKSNHGQSRVERPLGSSQRLLSNTEGYEKPMALVVVTQGKQREDFTQQKAPKSILKVFLPKKLQIDARSPSTPPPVRVSRGIKDRLASDDAEIAKLEKKLGIKKSSKGSKEIEENSLDSLLEGIDDAVGFSGGVSKKRKRTDADEWLEGKRAKTQAANRADVDPRIAEPSGHEEGLSANADVSDDLEGTDSEEDSVLDEEEDGLEVSSDSGDEEPWPVEPVKKIKENPYVAPIAIGTIGINEKYVPPSLRDKEPTVPEDLSRLKKQIQGLLNRLSEANLATILKDVEKLYRDHPRQHVSSILLDLLMGLLSDPTVLQDTFIILHAGFIAAVYKVMGTDFGAQAIQRIDDDFAYHYSKAKQGNSGKRLTNLISLVIELYNFQVISSNLIYDFVRMFLEDLSENNTELLLKIVRNAGPQLRQDDPSALKGIILQLQEAVTKAGEDTLSVRSKFMIETLNQLKNNRLRTGVAASSITSEHTVRMKKTLGVLNERKVRATEPLRVSLTDLRKSNERGKWWLVGASYKEDDVKAAQQSRQEHRDLDMDIDLQKDPAATDLIQLAKEQHMNTDVRRSIFVAMMSSTDANDAYIRLMKLNLKKSQEVEIPKVLIHCSGSEKVYNPFYTILSRRVCSDKKLKMAFQFSLWDLFKQMGEDEEGAEEHEQDESFVKLGLRTIVNLAKLFGILIAEGGLTLGVLKVRTDVLISALIAQSTDQSRTSIFPICRPISRRLLSCSS